MAAETPSDKAALAPSRSPPEPMEIEDARSCNPTPASGQDPMVTCQRLGCAIQAPLLVLLFVLLVHEKAKLSWYMQSSAAAVNSKLIEHEQHRVLWDEAEQKLPSGVTICDGHRPQQIAANGSVFAVEFCGKLTEKLVAKEFIAGAFVRCAAELPEKVANEMGSCWLTPFSKGNFMDHWRKLGSEGAIVVLGQGGSPFGKTPKVMIDRARAAGALHAETGFPIIATGGDDRALGFTEAMDMVNELFRMGVPGEAILYEPMATNTVENFWFGFQRISKYLRNPNKIVVMTSDYHLPRARLFAKLVLQHIQKMTKVPDHLADLKIESLAVESSCTTVEEKEAFVGSNTAGLRSRIESEIVILQNDIIGPKRFTLKTAVWGTEIDLVEADLKQAQQDIKALLDDKQKCTGPP